MPEDRPKIEYHAGSIADFDTCEYLFLRGLSEPTDNCLRLVIEEASGGRDLAPFAVGEISIPRQAIETLPGCRVFVVEWQSYFAYNVYNESRAAVGNKDDEFAGRLFRAYTSSAYLEFVRSQSFVLEDSDPRRHWGITCLNHIVEVVSRQEPEIRFAYVRYSPELKSLAGWSPPNQ